MNARNYFTGILRHAAQSPSSPIGRLVPTSRSLRTGLSAPAASKIQAEEADMRRMKIGGPALVRTTLAALLLSCSSARADVVADWNAIAADLASSETRGGAVRTMAIVNVAMFEVLNFVEGGYVPRFLVKPPAPLGGSGEAAAAAAAHHVLVESYPERKAALDEALERSLTVVAAEYDRTSARVWGTHLGENIRAAWAPADGVPKTRRPGASNAEPLGGVMRLNAAILQLVKSKPLKPIEAARIRALAWTAASEAYAAGGSEVVAGRAAALAALESRSGAPDVASLTPRRRP